MLFYKNIHQYILEHITAHREKYFYVQFLVQIINTILYENRKLIFVIKLLLQVKKHK